MKYFKNTLIIVFFFLGFFSCKAQKSPITLKIMTSNIRYANPDDGINYWDYRKDWYTNYIDFSEIDIIGAQEVLYSQLKDITQTLTEYDHIGIGREGGNKGEYSPIFYKKDRFQVLDSSTVWLSQTPEKIASVGWDAALPRIMTWAKMKEKRSNKEFFIFNTHFDHIGKKARLESAKLISKLVKEIAGDSPFFLTGDFNTPPSDEPYQVLTGKIQTDGYILKDSKKEAQKTYGLSYTFNGFRLNYEEEMKNKLPAGNDTEDLGRIDYIFYKGAISILNYQVLDIQRGAKFMSDHYPVIIIANFK